MDDAPAVHLIVFSKDRPLQLHGMLTSVFRYWAGDFKVTCLINPGADYGKAYVAVYKELMASLGAETERLVFELETGLEPERLFPASLLRILEGVDTPYVCFGCDDVVYTGPVDVASIDRAFYEEPRLLGFSLRLGGHTDTDMFGRPMPPPAFGRPAPPAWAEYAWVDAAQARVQWDAATSAGDWGYPWEVLGTVYPTDYVRSTVAALVRDGQVQNPSTLEDAGWRRWREFAGERHLLQSFARSRLVVPTVNVVQSVFGNGIVGPAGMDPAFLLDCWNRGLRLDVDRFRGMAPPSWRISDLFLRRAG